MVIPLFLFLLFSFVFFYFGCVSLGGKCSQSVELSGENINIAYKHDGTHMAVGNRVNSLFSFCFLVMEVFIS
jgi:hypothetical protein